ncbi:MAG: DinB family protein [Chloroflexi bacterium]|nr:MAG: DinB family protein [Chloroflexota bacterium]
MNSAELLHLQFEVMLRQFGGTLHGLSLERLYRRARAGGNSISFTLWHVLRTWDAYHATVQHEPGLYDDEWAARFGFDVSGRGIEGSGMGTGFTPRDVALVKARPKMLKAYRDALWAQTEAFLHATSDRALGRAVTIPWWPQPVPVARVYAHVVMHSLLHIGEANYLKGRLRR